MTSISPDWLFSDDQYQPVRLHAGDLSAVQGLTNKFDRELMEIRPYKDSPGIEYAENLISVFNQPSIEWSWWGEKFNQLQTPDVFSFEMWFSDGKLRFYISTPDEQMDSEVRSQIAGSYPDTQVSDADRLLPVFPEDGYLCGGRFDLSNTVYAPIRSFSGPDSFDISGDSVKSRQIDEVIDPYSAITSEIEGHQAEGVMVQIVFKTAPDEWVNGRQLGQPSAQLVVRGLQQGMFVDSWLNPRIEDPTEKQRKAAEYIGNITGMQV
jgi:hypothetical protein